MDLHSFRDSSFVATNDYVTRKDTLGLGGYVKSARGSNPPRRRL